MTIFPFNRGVRSAMGDHVDYVSVHSFLFHDLCRVDATFTTWCFSTSCHHTARLNVVRLSFYRWIANIVSVTIRIMPSLLSVCRLCQSLCDLPV